MSKARQAADEVNRQQAGRRNLIINGAMQVWQRGTSFTSITSAYYADRFQWTRSATMNVSRSTDVPDGFLYSCKSEVTAAGNWTLYHPLENPKRFKSGQKLTLSFYAKASTATDFRIGRVWDGSAYIAGYTVQNIGTEWKRYTQEITLSADALTQAALWVQVVSNDASLPSGLSVYITGVQLEVGDVATPFEHRSYGEELALCQRYYQKSHIDGFYHFPSSSGTQIQRQSLRFSVEMRASPTITSSKTGGSATSTVSNTTIDKDGVWFAFGGNQYDIAYWDWTADAEL